MAGGEFDARDTKSILHMAFYTPESRALAWDFYRQNFDTLASKLRSDEVVSLISLTGSFCEESRRAEVEALLRPRVAALEGGPRELNRALESIQVCVESERRNQPSVLEFLRHPQPVPLRAIPPRRLGLPPRGANPRGASKPWEDAPALAAELAWAACVWVLSGCLWSWRWGGWALGAALAGWLPLSRGASWCAAPSTARPWRATCWETARIRRSTSTCPPAMASTPSGASRCSTCSMAS